MKELEAEAGCPKCHALYGKIYRVQVREGIWVNQSEPESIPKYCAICEIPVERRRG